MWYFVVIVSHLQYCDISWSKKSIWLNLVLVYKSKFKTYYGASNFNCLARKIQWGTICVIYLSANNFFCDSYVIIICKWRISLSILSAAILVCTFSIKFLMLNSSRSCSNRAVNRFTSDSDNSLYQLNSASICSFDMMSEEKSWNEVYFFKFKLWKMVIKASFENY